MVGSNLELIKNKNEKLIIPNNLLKSHTNAAQDLKLNECQRKEGLKAYSLAAIARQS